MIWTGGDKAYVVIGRNIQKRQPPKCTQQALPTLSDGMASSFISWSWRITIAWDEDATVLGNGEETVAVVTDPRLLQLPPRQEKSSVNIRTGSSTCEPLVSSSYSDRPTTLPSPPAEATDPNSSASSRYRVEARACVKPLAELPLRLSDDCRGCDWPAALLYCCSGRRAPKSEEPRNCWNGLHGREVRLTLRVPTPPVLLRRLLTREGPPPA